MTVARYSVGFGTEGFGEDHCNDGAWLFTTRKSLADFIRAELEFKGMPKSLFRQVKIKNLWKWIKSHGSSVAHFDLCHKGYRLSFYGLTESEYADMVAEEF